MSASRTAARITSHLGVMVAVSVVLGVVVAGLAIPFAGLVGLSAQGVAETMDDLPEELETGDLAQRTTILDVDGNTIATLYDQNRVEVPLRQVSRTMVKAILSIEDYRFYEHGALDVKGTLRAFVTNQASGGTVQGGSSITQQLVKQTLINQAATEEEQAAATADTYARKLTELRYAVALEEQHSKDWILERYLNIVYFGDGAYGIQAAAKHFFNVNAKDLNVKQSAMLAGMVKNPYGYDPTNDKARAKDRRDVVIQRMADLSVISQKRAAKLRKQGLGLDVQKNQNGCVSATAPFFCDYVVNYLVADSDLGRSEKARRRLLYTGGLTIQTTLDMDFQNAADTSVSNAVQPTDGAIGGLAMVEPLTGDVKALAQSRPMGRKKKQGETYLNFVVPKEYGDSNGFQPGSTFKPFVLATAIEQGIPLNTQIASPQTITLPISSFRDCSGPIQSTQDYEVNNSTGYGTYTLYTGTQQSVNTFFVQLEQRVGICKPYNLAVKMGIQNLKGKTARSLYEVPAFTLGVADTSVLEMAEAYATFAGRGVHCDSRPVTSITGPNGNTVKEYDSSCERVMQATTADGVADVLRGVIEGGFASAQALDQPAGGKTGTTQSGRAVWFAGFTRNMAAVSMVAGVNNLGQPESLVGKYLNGRYVASASGSTYAAPIWGDAMKAIDDQLANENFVAPTDAVVNGVQTTVPSVSGMTIETARQTLKDAGFGVSVGSSVNSSLSAGLVAYSSPGGGSTAAENSFVILYPSNGVPPVVNTPSTGGNNDGGNNNGGNNGGNDGGGNNSGGGNNGNGNGGGNNGGGNNG
ncbi:transglycosylase domain-containing protein [Nocardioides bruguierae]|uniref:Transglycosylase domain-containing protein n=1 Tax=Nocardioides bruguierae TaxID=2945102 RepID=A0A9X2IEV2_9ACTN|nr:transglycosylase domain-containing protein [Nocardioides bruguierae]MCM0620692.1 transglycosylase domain-containing protein [Nocardioides bruguierae]